MNKVKIFIAHASEDHKFVWKLGTKMKEDLKTVADIFIDDWEIKVGDSIVYCLRIQLKNHGLKQN